MKRTTWKNFKNTQGNCFNERNFQKKNIKLMLISGPLRLTFKKTSKSVLYYPLELTLTFWIVHPENMLAKSTIFWMLLEVLVV